MAAPVERAEADSRLEAAQSLLVVPMAIVVEKGFFKVRTRECLTREAADAIKKRAIDSGFAGAFILDTNAPPSRDALSPHPAGTRAGHRRVPPSKRKYSGR